MLRLRRRHRTLASQILVLVAALVAGSALALGLIFGDAFRQHVHARTAAELQALASTAALMLADGLAERSRETTVITQSPDLWREGLDSPAVAALLDRVRAVNPNSLWIGVADAEGTVVAAIGGLLLGQDVSQRPWFAGGMSGPYVGDVHPAVLLEALLPRPAGGEPLRFLDFAAPIQVNGSTVGVLCMHVSWDWARQVTERVVPADAAARGVELLIFDRQGQLLYAPGGRTAGLRSAGQRLPVQETAARKIRWEDGQAYLTAMARLPPGGAADLGWHVVARAHDTRSFEPAREPLLVAAGAGLLVALGVCAVAWFEARRLGAELRRLALAAEGIEADMHSASLPVGGGSVEVRTLSHALRSMAQRLLQAHAGMEAQVRLRTAQLEEANAALEQLVRHDPLTGLLNRRGFEPKASLLFDLAMRGGRPLSVCMIDADHFKKINDAHGHAVGDQVLKSIADRLQGRMRRTDVLARWGGEEFVLLLPDSGIDAARQVADELRRAVAAATDATWGHVTVSVGLAQSTPTDASLDELLERADRALYRAKDRGRNQVSTFDALS